MVHSPTGFSNHIWARWKPGDRNSMLVSHMECRALNVWTTSIAFPVAFTGNCIISRAAKMHTHLDRSCWIPRWWQPRLLQCWPRISLCCLFSCCFFSIFWKSFHVFSKFFLEVFDETSSEIKVNYRFHFRNVYNWLWMLSAGRILTFFSFQ